MKSTQNHEKYYIENEKYSLFLNNQDTDSFKKYTDYIARFSSKDQKILDVGCGTGLAIELLLSKGRKNCIGIEISQTSLNICKKKKLNCKLYHGNTIPMKEKVFDVVASINVLEHTNNPIHFLDEMYRVVRKNGYIIIVCPNFLSVTNNYHKNTRGFMRKVTNLVILLRKSIGKLPDFEKMEPIDREYFQPDDDAINATNPIDIMKWAHTKRLRLEYWSSQQQNRTGILAALDIGPIRALLGSCFFVYKKV